MPIHLYHLNPCLAPPAHIAISHACYQPLTSQMLSPSTTSASLSLSSAMPSSLPNSANYSTLRRDTGFLVFSFPRSLGSGVYDEINGGQRKLVRTYLNYISTKFRPIWMRIGARVSKTPC